MITRDEASRIRDRLLEVLREAGVDCPRDVSIVGYNDGPLTAYLDPPLTTLHLPGYELGLAAGDTVVGMLDEPDASPDRLTMPPTLVVRSSTAAPHATARRTSS